MKLTITRLPRTAKIPTDGPFENDPLPWHDRCVLAQLPWNSYFDVSLGKLVLARVSVLTETGDYIYVHGGHLSPAELKAVTGALKGRAA